MLERRVGITQNTLTNRSATAKFIINMFVTDLILGRNANICVLQNKIEINRRLSWSNFAEY